MGNSNETTAKSNGKKPIVKNSTSDQSIGDQTPIKNNTFVKNSKPSNPNPTNPQINGRSKFERSNSPLLNTPTQYRNNTAKNSANGDIFQAINPLPNIKSPYLSARDLNYRYPNLESWGVTNQPFDDMSSYRNVSPFLPVFNSIARTQKVKMISKFI